MLSVVIATYDSERELVPTLAPLVAGAAAGLISEVIVADGGSSDETAEVADIAGCRLLASRASLGARLDQAAAQARAPWLMFLRPGTVLDATWIAEVMRFISETDAAGGDDRAAVFRPASAGRDARPMLAEAFALIRVALGGRARPEQGLLIAKGFYRRLGGHRHDAADPETDLLRVIGPRRTVVLRSAAVTTGKRRIIN